jgi:acyl carrier protein
MIDLNTDVARTVADVLNVDVAEVTAAPSLFDLAGFDSLAIVAVLDRLENERAVEVPAELILPEAFASIDSLGELLTHGVPMEAR